MIKDYKSTLNMPKTNFEMKANLNKKEPQIQAQWIQNKIYEKLLEKNKNNPTFILHDGPPYANGSIHIGHALNKILKDFIVSYKNMNGFYSPYIPGWDTHGLPIEVALSKKKNLNNTSVVERRELCKNYALEQIDIQKNQFMRLGMTSDFNSKYLTLDHSFEIDQLKLFANMFEKGFVYQDFKPVFWSWSSQTALAESEIEYGDRQSPAIYVKMQAVDIKTKNNNKTSFIIWTTTPWTLPANKAIAIHPETKYAVVQTKDENYIVATNLVSSWTKEVKIEEYQIIDEYDAKQLENKLYISPITKQKVPIILADYVSSNDGTGLVHNAPAYGLDDYYACKKYNIESEVNIDQYGKYNSFVDDDELNGMFYEEANEVIINRLKNDGNLLDYKTITHSVAHDWRTKKPLMFRATKQWFVSVAGILPSILKTLDNDVQSTSLRGIERMREMVVNRKEWCISRQRVWGVPIPMIFDEDDNVIDDIQQIKHTIEVLNQKGVNAWFSEDVSVFLLDKYKNDGKNYKKEKDIMDVWFDSGSSYSILNRNNLPYPADMYLEGYDQYRGWFNSSIITGTILNNKAPYKFLLAHGMVLDGDGFKMSKSKGNVVDPLSVCDVYGADVLRLWVASSDFLNDCRISDDILKQVAETYRRIRNTLFKYSLSILDGFNPDTSFTYNVRQEDLYVLNQFNDMYQKVVKAYDNYEFGDVIKLFNKFVLDLSSWYFENIKDDMYCLEWNNPVRTQIQSTVYFILKHSLTALTPIIPHTTEEAYSHLVGSKKESIKLEEFYKQQEFKFSGDFSNVSAFFEIKDVIFNELENARKNNVLKKNNEALVHIDESLIKSDYLKNNPKLLAKWFNVAKVKLANKNYIENANFKKCLRCWNHYEDDLMHDEEISKRCFEIISKSK